MALQCCANTKYCFWNSNAEAKTNGTLKLLFFKKTYLQVCPKSRGNPASRAAVACLTDDERL